ncbi:hypothetical protein BGZ57DRAFT_936131 [Hyaloscypha finlandica]|nr:hypothetical protein BGZ57DRAFT_936131 [Hyaloscypha finlandica]
MEGLIPIAMAVAWMTLCPSPISFSRIGKASLTQSFVTLRSQVDRADLSSQSPVTLYRSSSVDVPHCPSGFKPRPWQLYNPVAVLTRYVNQRNRLPIYSTYKSLIS